MKRGRPLMTRQLNLFGDGEPEFPGLEGSAAAAWRPDPDEVRAELFSVLAKARAARTIPWDARGALYWRTVFPQMTNWLPDAEAAQLRLEFEAEIKRLDAGRHGGGGRGEGPSANGAGDAAPAGS